MYLVDTFGQSVPTTSTRIESEHADFHVVRFLREPKGCFLHFCGEILGEKTARNRKRTICGVKRARVNKGWLVSCSGGRGLLFDDSWDFLLYFEYFLNILLMSPWEELERLLKERDNLYLWMGFLLTYCLKICQVLCVLLWGIQGLSSRWRRGKFVDESKLVMDSQLFCNVFNRIH